MFKLVKSETFPLTRDRAEQHRDLPPSPTERPSDKKRIEHLQSRLLNGLAVPFNWAVACLGENTYRANGQHSSQALCRFADGQFPNGLQAHLDTYQIEDLGDLAVLFQQFDGRRSTRSVGDVAGAYQGLYDDLRSVPRKFAKLAIDGVLWWRRQVERVPTDSDDTAYHIFDEIALHGFVRSAGNTLGPKTPEMNKPVVTAAMYATSTKSEAAAAAFWTQVARGGEEYNETAPATVLSDWLQKADKPNGKGKPKPGDYYQACIFAWNAYREDKSIKTIRAFDAKKGWPDCL
jgi:hypothetical protein